MKLPYFLTCPKCGGNMYGPHYVNDGYQEQMRYGCGCGYKTTIPPADAKVDGDV